MYLVFGTLTFRNSQLLLAELDSIKDCNKSILETGVSKLEGFCPAMFLRQNVPLNHKTVPRAPWEIAHIHDADGSLHMIISPGDAKMVVEKAWGERHPLSGRAGGVPITYTMIYAPRTEEEVKVQGRILRAAVWYGVEGREEIK